MPDTPIRRSFKIYYNAVPRLMPVFLSAFMALPFSQSRAEVINTTFHGTAVDGDTLRDPSDSQSYRLFGIDACEHDQLAYDQDGKPWPCGIVATQWLVSHIAGQILTCTILKEDRYHRHLAKCGTKDIPDLGARMIQDGQAVVYRFHGMPTEPAYVSNETKARENHRGIWQGTVEEPFRWRQTHRHDHNASSQ